MRRTGKEVTHKSPEGDKEMVDGRNLEVTGR
jgi:hypothetical protein